MFGRSLFNCLFVAVHVSFCLFWALGDAAILNTYYLFLVRLDLDWHSRPQIQFILLWKKECCSVYFIFTECPAFFQSQRVIQAVCDISKWASYFVIDWQPVTILTQSLTFCRTCTPKSCFWPFSLFAHSDRRSLALSIFRLIWSVLHLPLQIKPCRASLSSYCTIISVSIQ